MNDLFATVNKFYTPYTLKVQLKLIWTRPEQLRAPSSQRQHKLNFKTLLHTQNKKLRFLHSDPGTNTIYISVVFHWVFNTSFDVVKLYLLNNRYFYDFEAILQI